MQTISVRKNGGGWLGRIAVALALAAGTSPALSRAQDQAAAAPKTEAPESAGQDAPDDLSVLLSRYERNHTAKTTIGQGLAADSKIDGDVSKTGCASCGGHGPRVGGGSCGSCGRAACVPGQANCNKPCPESYYGRLFGGLYECLCCPDPCYQPAWIPEANASFFTDYARPRTVTRFRWDHGWNMRFPDRSEYFWAKINGGKGPMIAKGPNGRNGETGLNWDQMYLYQEVAAANASFFIEMPYRATYPDISRHYAGFGDLNFGTKSLLIDCEMLQVTFQFKTYTPTGQPGKGLGTGHVSLEPALLLALRLAEGTYFQGQIAEWIPLGGDKTYAGSILKYNWSFNQVLARPTVDSPIIGTMEFTGMTFQDGAYTDPNYFRNNGARNSSGGTYLSIGPGLRHSVCDKFDYGGSVVWQVTDSGQWANPLLRLEMRLLY